MIVKFSQKCIFTKILVTLLMVCMLVSLHITTIFAAPSADGGLEFVTGEPGFIDLYKLNNNLKFAPATFEATLYFPETFSGRGGVIVGNYSASGIDAFNLEIGTSGFPRFLIYDNETKLDVVFTEVDVYTGEKIHMTITWDTATKTALCYINGELKQTITSDKAVNIKNLSDVVLGGDNRNVNAGVFRGKLYELTLYEDIRTEAEIVNDYQNSEVDFSGLLGHWDLENVKSTDNVIVDISANKNNFERNIDPNYFSEKEPLKEWAYSFAVVGDTQSLNLYNPHNMHHIYDWIADNVEKKNIKFVMQLGDITDKSNIWEYAVAKACMHSLDGKVPYSIVRGNHDKDAQFDMYINQYEYGHTIDGSYDNSSMRNIYYKLTVGNIKYLIFALDIGTEERVLKWAGDVINQHPDYNVIITTHIYINSKGDYFTNESKTKPTKYNTREGAMNSDEFWDKFVSKYENIKLVVCGHTVSENVVVSRKTGDKGNVVTQVLVNPQSTDLNTKASGGVGMVAMLYFSNDGSEVQVEYYSTVRKKFYKKENQFSFNVEVVKNGGISPNATLIADNEEFVSVPYNQNVRLLIDNKEITFDLKPHLCNGRLLFPMRKVFEALGASVTWDNANQTATAVKDNNSITFSVDSNTVVVNGMSKKSDVPTKLISSTTMVPIRMVSEALKYEVEWDGENNIVSVFTK